MTRARFAGATIGLALVLAIAVPARAAEIKVLSGNGALLRFLTASAAAPVLQAAGMEPFAE
jgi:hypothetical protein